MERLLQDVAYGLRSFRRSPGFVAVALLSLTLGIGATTAIFSVIYAVLISPYPYARPGDILRLMLRMGGGLVITGLAVGVVASLFATRLLRSQLFGVSETDLLAYAAVAAVLGLVALLACYLPSRRAAAVEPLVALRHQ
ncbi:hypothetical protein BH24ACI4_BH24ACI4_26700 [soil metagenome]